MADIVFPGPKDPRQFPDWRFETLNEQIARNRHTVSE
jgi:hypothetical protein